LNRLAQQENKAPHGRRTKFNGISMKSTENDLVLEIAALKHRLQEVTKENQRLASFAEMDPNPVLEINLAGAITFANKAARQVLRSLTPPDRLINFLPLDWKCIQASTQVQGKRIFFREVRIREKIFSESIAFIEPYQVWRLHATDITERHWAEEALREAHNNLITEKNRLEAVFDALPVGLTILDEEGGSIQSNAAFEELWGGPRPQVRDFSDYKVFKAWWLDTGKQVRPEEWACFQALQHGKTVIGQMLEIENFAGERRSVINSGASIRDADGKIIGSAVPIVDITEQRRAEASRERLRILTGQLITAQETERKLLVAWPDFLTCRCKLSSIAWCRKR
jgi:PAS domain S-box-containing protein